MKKCAEDFWRTAGISEDKIREAGIECRFLNTDFNTCLGNIEKYIISVLY
mgnify:CR=1 FL=1